MRSTMRKMTVTLLLTVFLAPGLAQARGFSWESATVSPNIENGFFGMVWNLLTSMFEKNGGALDPSGATSSGDNGGALDPSGSTGSTTGTTDESDNGGALDPSGAPE